MIVSSLIIFVAALFFFGVAVQYLSLVPPHPQSVIAVCGGLAGELPGSTCVPSSQLNDTVQLYKHVRNILPTGTYCKQSEKKTEQEVAEEILDNPKSKELWKFFGNLLVLLKQNQSWGCAIVSEMSKTFLFLVRKKENHICTAYTSVRII